MIKFKISLQVSWSDFFITNATGLETQQGRFLSIFLGNVGGYLLGNLLSSKEVIQVGDAVIRAETDL